MALKSIYIPPHKIWEAGQKGKTFRFSKIVSQLSGVPIPKCKVVLSAVPKALAILLNETGSYWWKGFMIFYKVAKAPRVYEGLNRRTMQRQLYRKGWRVWIRATLMRGFSEWCGAYKDYDPKTDKILKLLEEPKKK